MAIRTISIFQGHYFALQGQRVWNELLDLSFVDVLTRSRRADHSISSPTIFTTPPPQHHLPTSPLILSDHRMAGIYLGGMSRVHVEHQESTDAVTGAEDDLELSSLDGSLCSAEFDPPSRIESSHDICGLGISGLWLKDGSGPFTGLGVISVRPFPWKYVNLVSGHGDTVAGETVYHHHIPHEGSDTNVDTALAQTQVLESIVERDPGSSDAPHVATESTPTRQPVTHSHHSHSRHRTPSLPRQMKRFAAPTISSELKRISHICTNITHPNKLYRRRLSGPGVVSRRVNPSRFIRPHSRTGIDSPALRRSSDTPIKFTDKVAT